MEIEVTLTPALERFALGCVESGRFETFSDVILAALDLLREADERHAAFVDSTSERSSASFRRSTTQRLLYGKTCRSS